MYTSGECSGVEGGSASVWVWGALGRQCVACMNVLGSESMCTLECGAHVCIFECANVSALVCTYMGVGVCQFVSVCLCI